MELKWLHRFHVKEVPLYIETNGLSGTTFHGNFVLGGWVGGAWTLEGGILYVQPENPLFFCT